MIWEYLDITISTAPHDTQELRLELKRLGEEGWELTAVDKGRYFFKREVNSEMDKLR